MGLDIGLVDGLGGVAALDDDLGLREAGGDVALGVGDALGDVGGLGGLGVEPGGVEVVVQHRRIRRHRRLDVDDVGQHFVLDRDERQRRLGDGGRDGGDGGDGVALVERLVAGHAVAREVAEVHRAFADERLLVGDLGEVGGGHHGAHAGELFRLRGVDGEDAGMRVRAALDLGPQHPRQRHVGAELGAAGDFIDAVGADRAGADDLQLGLGGDVVHAGLLSARSSAAASSTAARILS